MDGRLAPALICGHRPLILETDGDRTPARRLPAAPAGSCTPRRRSPAGRRRGAASLPGCGALSALFEKSVERQANRIAGIAALTEEVLATLTAEDIPIP